MIYTQLLQRGAKLNFNFHAEGYVLADMNQNWLLIWSIAMTTETLDISKLFARVGCAVLSW